MKIWCVIAIALAGAWSVSVLTAASSAAADVLWPVKWERPVEGRLGDVLGPMAFVVGRQGTSLIPINKLDEAGLGRVSDFLAAREAGAVPTWSSSNSPVVKSLRGRLLRAENGKLAAYDPGDTPAPAFFLVYFSAHWCGPCRRYTPELVAGYQRLQEKYPGMFELIFMSSDESAKAQAKYVQEAGMPWPVVKFSAVSSVKPLARWAGSGIPCLVLLSRDGDVIAHSYRGEDYIGPTEVWAQFEKLAALTVLGNPETRRIMHPIAVRRHLATPGAGDRPAQAYLIGLDRSRYRDLAGKTFMVSAEVDATGTVTSATTEPELPWTYASDFSRDAQSWLFLPAVEAGQPKPQAVRFELKL